MKTQLAFIIIFLLGLGGLQTVQAQDVVLDERSTELVESAEPTMILEPKYAFTGALARDNNITIVHCSNLGDSSVQIQVNLDNFLGAEAGQASAFIAAGQTYTISFGSTLGAADTDFFTEDVRVGVDPVNQGKGTILTDPQTAPVICEAQVILRDADGNLQEIIPLNMVPVSAAGVPTV